MSGGVIGGLIALVLLLVAGVAWLAWRAEQKRRAAFLLFATGHGLTYAVQDNTHTLREGTPFGVGDTRRAKNVLSGPDTLSGSPHHRPFVAFDYTYVTTSSDGKNTNRQTHRFQVIAVRLPTFLPRVQVTEENLFHKLGGLLGFEDIELESEDFNRRFRVTADDRKLAYDVLSARTMQALLGRDDVAMRIQDGELVAWDTGRTDLEDLARRLATAAVLLDGIPDFVWADHGGQQ